MPLVNNQRTTTERTSKTMTITIPRPRLVLALTIAMAAIIIAACSGDGETSQEDLARDTRDSNTERLIADQPAETMNYSPTRETINEWIRTWGQQEGKLAYVYLITDNYVGYYVIEGLPVSYCVSITQPYDIIRVDAAGGDQDVIVPAEGMDAAYYGGCDLVTKYAVDATTGEMLQWSVGVGQNEMIYETPRDLFVDILPTVPLGFTAVDDNGELVTLD